jgi:hypothetical protein
VLASKQVTADSPTAVTYSLTPSQQTVDSVFDLSLNLLTNMAGNHILFYRVRSGAGWASILPLKSSHSAQLSLRFIEYVDVVMITKVDNVALSSLPLGSMTAANPAGLSQLDFFEYVSGGVTTRVGTQVTFQGQVQTVPVQLSLVRGQSWRGSQAIFRIQFNNPTSTSGDLLITLPASMECIAATPSCTAFSGTQPASLPLQCYCKGSAITLAATQAPLGLIYL